LSRIIRRPRIDATAALLYSPRMAKKIYLRPRCVQLAGVLKKTGSFYYHCDWHASHYVKVMLDQIFGENNFQNEIIWN
jgi:DNA modification methylase